MVFTDSSRSVSRFGSCAFRFRVKGQVLLGFVQGTKALVLGLRASGLGFGM